jgi:hypothetical protein
VTIAARVTGRGGQDLLQAAPAGLGAAPDGAMAVWSSCVDPAAAREMTALASRVAIRRRRASSARFRILLYFNFRPWIR